MATLFAACIGAWLIPQSGSEVAVDGDLSPVVPLFNAWTAWWNYASVLQDGGTYWSAPIFAPATDAFAYSEPQPATLCVAALLAAGLTPVAAYNVYLAVSIAANGLVASLFASKWCRSPEAVVFAGVAVAALPIVASHRHVGQLVPIWPIIWFLSSAISWWQEPTWRATFSTAAAAAATASTSVHHALCLGITVAVASPAAFVMRASFRYPRQNATGTGSSALRDANRASPQNQPSREPSPAAESTPEEGVRPTLAAVSWRITQHYPLPLFCGVLIAAALTAPIVLPIQRATKANKFERSEALVAQLSATADAYCTAPSSIWSQENHVGPEKKFLRPPAGYLALAIAALVAAVAPTRRREEHSQLPSAVLAIALVATVSCFLSFGEHLRFSEWSLWRVLADVIPGVAQIRSAYRFAMITHISLVLMATLGLDIALRLAKSRRTALTTAIAVLAAALAAAGVTEQFPRSPITAGVPSLKGVPQNAIPRWQDIARQITSESGSMLCLPMGDGRRLESFRAEARWMYLSTVHGRRLVNGYSGFFPAEYLALRDRISNRGITADLLRDLRAIGAETIVVDQRRTHMLADWQNLPLEVRYDDRDFRVFHILSE